MKTIQILRSRLARTTAPFQAGRAPWITLLSVGIALCGITISAGAATTIFILDGNGTPQDVTLAYTYQQHIIYDSLSIPIGTIDETGHIWNSANQLIGYIVQEPGD